MMITGLSLDVHKKYIEILIDNIPKIFEKFNSNYYRSMKIRKIFLDNPMLPCRWYVVLDNWSIITIRERGNNCIIHKGIKSIFYVTDEDIIKHFVSKNSSDFEVLDEAIQELGAELMPGAREYERKYIEYENSSAEEWVQTELRKAKLSRLL